ncbi:MAG: NADH-quinone oxidoreductase subunit NuoE [Desulfobacterales bacterium]|jgi:NADH-quinone oxidoreductase subunit E|nr:NADH-quinone oxidoreductase subunit NuoE [Desulfobacterales bacterium]
MKNTIKDIIKPYQDEKGSLIPILQAVQEKTGFISEEAISTIALKLKMSEHEIYGVATFYTQFRYTKPGDHMVKVCLGTACHVRGGDQLLERTETILNIKPGQTTPDSAFSLERVACMGCCALAPVIVVDDKIYPNVTTPKIEKIISKYSS